MTTAELLQQRLTLVYRWYQGMVNPEVGTLEYLYLPRTNTFVRQKCPIRDIASVWDVELLSTLLNRDELQGLVETSLGHYGEYLIQRDGYLILDSRRLGESSNIAHSAFMLLALLHAPPPYAHQPSLLSERDRPRTIAGLAEGILRQQRPDGSYHIYFHDLPDEGEELYAGEAVLALLETYRQAPEERYMDSAERSLSYYDAQYFQRGRVTEDVLVFFVNWQSQASRILFECTPSAALRQQVSGYVFRMQDRIIESGFYRNVERQPDHQVSVEVACALEGLNDAYAIARAMNDDRARRYRQGICTGLDYLLRLQCVAGGTQRERGGFGLSFQDRTQRIDITGHAASAMMKSLANGISCRTGPLPDACGISALRASSENVTAVLDRSR
jgi:hypothetical protein